MVEYGGLCEGDAAVMVSSEGLESKLTSSGRSGTVTAWISGRVVAVWVLSWLSARAARLSSLKSEIKS